MAPFERPSTPEQQVDDPTAVVNKFFESKARDIYFKGIEHFGGFNATETAENLLNF